MKLHELKILPQYFSEVLSGNKRFEIRKNDRDFKQGDIVKLREFNGKDYTGYYIKAKIGYVLKGGNYGLDENYCVFSIIIISHGED